ncbi:MAG: formylglycine-generating enzyme family protein [Parvibaculaceae bacterium]|nr:formylglycine-generating enzyme family protein [Parvibaculaceae bacterium]HBM87513.1 chromophore maturation protein PvdO [Rhodobiaceae bacterium]|tara:strand:+ start:327 stop:1211 length:885 start_codon:yes stop_codon:yes gene_type:complete
MRASLLFLIAILLVSAATSPSAYAATPGETIQDCELCPELVVIPAGSFKMGQSRMSGGGEYEQPVHTVTIAAPFAIGKFEVTYREFAAFVQYSGYAADSDKNCGTVQDGVFGYRLQDWDDPGYLPEDDFPAVCVSWDAAKAYVDWLSRETGETYRLPSEAEWEYVVRAGTTTRFWTGSSESSLRGRMNCAPELCGDEYVQVAPVGSFPANVFGVHDMTGNVSEWVEDCFHETYDGAPANGAARVGSACAERTYRGGSWDLKFRTSYDLRSAARSPQDPRARWSHFGFRVVRHVN